MKSTILCHCFFLLCQVPAFGQVIGTYWDQEGNLKEAVFVKQDMLSDCNQQFFTRAGSKMSKHVPTQSAGYVIEGDTFVTRHIEGQPLFLRKHFSGPVSLYSADEVVLHQVLVERTGQSPLDPMSTNLQRSHNKNDTSIDTPIGILMWEDGEYCLINPNRKAEALSEMKRFLSGYPEVLPAIPANQKTITFDYLKDVAVRYNAWQAKQSTVEGEKTGF